MLIIKMTTVIILILMIINIIITVINYNDSRWDSDDHNNNKNINTWTMPHPIRLIIPNNLGENVLFSLQLREKICGSVCAVVKSNIWI